MSRTFLVKKNKNQKQQKTNVSEYLYNSYKPQMSASIGLNERHIVKEVDETDIMRLHLLHMSQRLKSRWA